VPPGESVRRVPTASVRPCALQPRKQFTAASLDELAASIREQGIVQPLVVRERNGGYELIAGERRWRAAQSIGLKEVPVILREAGDREVLELALIENLQRENLNPIEEALGYGQLIGEFELTQEEVATKVGRSRVAVANALRLLRLPEEVKEHVRNGSLTVGHAKVILGLTDEAEVLLAAKRVLKDGLNVRQTEVLVAHLQQTSTTSKAKTAANGTAPRDVHVTDLENRLREKLGTKVTLRYKGGKGSLDIRFFSDEELQRVLDLVGISQG
jgi:ParB family chromosome partitioning protein